jgi:hypothetical protein
VPFTAGVVGQSLRPEQGSALPGQLVLNPAHHGVLIADGCHPVHTLAPLHLGVAGFTRISAQPLEDLLIGWPMAGLLAVMGGIRYGT